MKNFDNSNNNNNNNNENDNDDDNYNGNVSENNGNNYDNLLSIVILVSKILIYVRLGGKTKTVGRKITGQEIYIRSAFLTLTSWPTGIFLASWLFSFPLEFSYSILHCSNTPHIANVVYELVWKRVLRMLAIVAEQA